MAFCGKVTTLFVVILAIGIFYFVNMLIPDNVGEPWKARIFCTSIKIINCLAVVGEVFGLGSCLNNTRAIHEFLAKPLNAEVPSGMTVEETTFSGVQVRIYRYASKHAETRGLIFYHGGAWAFGSINTHAAITKSLAQMLEATVISVNYRLAPETTYPGAFEDCVKAATYFITHAGLYGVDPRRIAIVGDSAGGNLAASVSLKLRGLNVPFQPKLQVLVYPFLQAFDFQLPSHLNNDNSVYFTRYILAKYLLSYMGASLGLIPELLANNHTSVEAKKEYAKTFDLQLLPEKYRLADWPEGKRPVEGSIELFKKLEKKLVDLFFSPLMAHNLAGLPEALVLTMEHDPLRDEGILYARKLEYAGVKVTSKTYAGGYHGVLDLIEGPLTISLGADVLDNVVTFLNEKL